MAGVKGKSGRKPGVSFAQLTSFADKKEFHEFVMGTYKESPDLTKWVGNQLFGSAPASLDVTSGGEKFPQPILGGITEEKDNG